MNKEIKEQIEKLRRAVNKEDYEELEEMRDILKSSREGRERLARELKK